jgi:streptogramin lyase
VQRIATGRGTDGVAVGAGSVWVASGIDGRVARIDPASGRIREHIDVGTGLREVAVGPDGVWVTRDAI